MDIYLHNSSNLVFDASLLLFNLSLPLDAGGGDGGGAGGGGGGCGGGRLPQQLLHLLRQVGNHLEQ